MSSRPAPVPRGLLGLTGLLGGLLSCASEGSADTAAPQAVAFCEGELRYEYDPDEALTTFPDDWWTVADPDTTTGLRVHIDPDSPAVSAFPDEYDNLLRDLGTLDGFGLSPEHVLEFGRALPEDLEVLEVSLLTEGPEGWESHPVSLSTIDHGRTLLVRPWRPLPPARRGVLGLRADLGEHGCVSPSETLRALLTDPEQALHERYAAGLEALGWEAGEVGAMTVFTTQSAGEVDAAVLADVDTRELALDGPMDCAAGSAWRECSGTVTVGDYRDEHGVVPHDEAVSRREEYALPVSLWLPPEELAGPYPVLLCGHGLTGSRRQCRFAAELAAPLGVAVLAVDAQEHGDHPDRTSDGSELVEIMALCGFTLVPASFDALVLRDNFRASAWDKLQVLRAVQAGWDVEGDGVVDLDPERVQYAGASLGGIMGPELLALAPELGAGVLIVPGGGLMDLFIQSESFGIIATAMTPGDWDSDDLARVVPMLQALVDAGDPLVFAAAMSRDRLEGEERAHLALLMAWEDTVVPNIATTRLAQAFEVETVGTALVEIPGVPEGGATVAGNLVDGATGGLLQLDRTQAEEGSEWQAADHSYVHDSVQGTEVLEPFMLSVLAGELPVLEDPYDSP